MPEDENLNKEYDDITTDIDLEEGPD